jgi:hypothetical protein
MIFIGAFVVFVLVKGPGMDVHIPMVVPKAGGFRKGRWDARQVRVVQRVTRALGVDI